MTPISLTGTGVLITLIEFVLRALNIEFPEGSVESAVSGIIAFIGLVLLIIGQLRRKDLHAGLIRK